MTLLLPCFGSNCTRKARRGKASLLCLLLVMTLLVGMVQPAAADEEYVCEIDGGDQYETLAAALAAVEAGQTKTIRMLKNHDYVGGIIIDDKNVTVELNSFSVNSLNLTSGQTGLTVRNGGTFALSGDGAFNVTGHISGVFATGDGSSATVTNASATSSYGNGAVAMYGGDIVVNGNALGGYNGVSVANSGSTVIVNGNATGTASDSSGARAASGGSVTINGGTAQGVMHGAYANGSENGINSSIMINGGDAIGTGDSYSQGAHAELGGSIHIDGDVQGAEYGVVSSTDSIVAISGSVTVTKEANGVGVDAERGGTIEIGGNVVANGSSLGAFATSEAEITIDGEIQASNYIRIFDDIEEVPVDMDENDGVINPIKPGYYEYSAGTSTVWVKVPAADTTPPVWTAGYPGTSYVSDEDLGLSVSADEVCMVYYVVLANNAQAPTSARVRNGQDGEGNAIPYPGSDSFEYTDPPGIKSHGVLGLAPETAYDIYVVLMDGNDNLQSEPAKIDVTTLQDIDTIPVDAKSGITHQEQGADGSKQVTLTVTVQNAAGDPINGIGPGYFEVSVDGSSVQRFDTSPLFSGFADNGGGTYTVTFTGDADDKEYEFTDLSVFDVVIDSSYTVTTPPADSQIATAGEGWSMGLNNYGQLGIGSFVNKDTPTQIGDETDWASVAAGDSHTLAVKSDGSLWAWGWNSEGQIGDGTDVNKRSPTLISADEDGKWVMVAAGGVHSLALKENGSLWAWGYNVCGQLGVGDFADRNTPTQVGTDTDWVAVTAGMDHSVAVKSDGSLWAWGSGHYGQLGNGIEGSGNWVNAPMKIGQDSDWAAVSAGYRHNVARKEDGTLWTWGDNTSHDTSNRICGQLGGGITAECVTAPTKISAAGEVWQAAAAGKYHTAAIKSDGSLWTWGGNAYGELGIGTIDSNTHANPAQVGEGTDWAAVITGYRHNAAWKTDGSLWFWGHNGTGQLGVATPWSQNSPKKTIGDDRDWIAVATGDAHTVLIKAADGGEPQLPALSGVSITGSAIYGEILTANINYTSQAPEDEPVYQWKRSGVDITGATAATYILGEADIGQTITVAATADGIHATGSAVSTATALVEKADTAPPAMPVLSGKTHNSVTLTANATHEFRVDGGAWQANNAFTGLSPGTEYTFTARVKETATHKASAAGAGLSVKTDAAPNTGGSGGGSGTSVLKIKPANPPAGTAGATYTHTFAASGGTKPYTFAVTGGSLPDSLVLEENGRLTGTPAAEGTYEITVTVEDHAGRISTHAFTLIITESEATEPSDILPDAPLPIKIVLTVGKPEALVDGEPVRLDAAPYIEAPVGRTFVPVRFIGEALGATVEWLAASKQVVIRDGGTEIILTIGSKTVLVNGEAQAIDCSPVVLPPGRTFVPLRFVSETLGASVDYDGAAKQITICR